MVSTWLAFLDLESGGIAFLVQAIWCAALLFTLLRTPQKSRATWMLTGYFAAFLVAFLMFTIQISVRASDVSQTLVLAAIWLLNLGALFLVEFIARFPVEIVAHRSATRRIRLALLSLLGIELLLGALFWRGALRTVMPGLMFGRLTVAVVLATALACYRAFDFSEREATASDTQPRVIRLWAALRHPAGQSARASRRVLLTLLIFFIPSAWSLLFFAFLNTLIPQLLYFLGLHLALGASFFALLLLYLDYAPEPQPFLAKFTLSTLFIVLSVVMVFGETMFYQTSQDCALFLPAASNDAPEFSETRYLLSRNWPTLAILAGSMLCIYWVFPIFFRVNLMTPLEHLLHGVRDVQRGHRQIAIPVSYQDEIGFLTASFNEMVATLAQYEAQLQDANRTLEQKIADRTAELSQTLAHLQLTQMEIAAAYEEIRALNTQLQAENLRMSAELDVSRRIQQMMLPAPEELRQIEGLDIVGYMQPADEVGGDYYDVLKERGIIHIGVGDVTGHGLESGILMLMVQTAIRTLVEHGETDPVTFLSTLNRVIMKNVSRMGVDKTLTLVFVKYQKGLLKIAGQHEDLLVIRRGGAVELVDTMDLGFPLGLEENIARFVAEATVTLHPGDSIVLYTDGITESESPQGTLYGLERLCAVLSRQWDQSAEAMKQAVVEDVMRHIDTRTILDDLTLVVLKRT